MTDTTKAPCAGVCAYLWLHAFAILGLLQVVFAYLAGATDVFSVRAVKVLILVAGLLNVILGYLKTQVPRNPLTPGGQANPNP